MAQSASLNDLTARHSLIQRLRWGKVDQERLSPGDTMYALTGLRLYVIGDIDGRFRPRSNPYDLHAFGKPHPDDPLAERLQGVWAQPVKGLNGYEYSLEWDGEPWPLKAADAFTQSFAGAQFEYRCGSISAVRSDSAARNLPLLLSTLTIRSDGQRPLDMRVRFTAYFDLADAWFTHLGPHRNDGELLSIEENCLIARAALLPDRWAAAAGGSAGGEPITVRLLEGSAGELSCLVRLEPGVEQSFTFAIAIDSQDGAPGALRILKHGLKDDQISFLRNEQEALYDYLYNAGPHLRSPDSSLNAAFDIARANLQFLEAAPPALGSCFYAGLEMFPFWFSNDGAYSTAGLLAAGLTSSTLNHIRIGLKYQDQGRVPHQVSPSGKTAFPGNAQETPLWVMSVWEAYRWTGDRDFLAEMYPGAVQGMFDYVLGTIDPDGDGYPSGPGMVEVSGMGPEKLDSAAYTWAALHAMAKMAAVLGDAYTEKKALEWAENRIRANFDADWWDNQGGTYAMSLEDPSNALAPVPHWAVVTPLEVGLASPAHAAATFAALRQKYLNRWGLKHTVGDDERVWTLPTATLSRAAFRYREPELGFYMLRRIAETLDTGSIGLFHELIPQGACFVQLWSAATFLRGIIEDLLGIDVNAGDHSLRITPHLLAAWNDVELRSLTFGAHTVHIQFSQSSVRVEHVSGPLPLSATVSFPSSRHLSLIIPPGEHRSFLFLGGWGRAG